MAFSQNWRTLRFMWSSFTVKMRTVFDKSLQIGGPFYIGLAVTLLSCIIYLFYATILPSIHSINSLTGITHILISIWLIINVFFNYFNCIKTDPGRPTGVIDVEHDPISQINGQIVSSSPMRWCKSCQKTKPPMTHHCHICKRCILKMDHHCPWMHNCVGFFNYRFFFLFLFYLWVGCAYTTYMASISLQKSDENAENSQILFTFVLAIAVFFSLTGIFSFHIYLVLTAQTTIDFYASRRRRRQARLEARQRGEKFLAPIRTNSYDLGKIRNLRSLFDRGGAYWWLIMFLPHKLPPRGNGIHFTLRVGNDHESASDMVSNRFERVDLDIQVESLQNGVSRH